MDRPIIFSGPMVRALLDGRKTMTRRLAWRICNVCSGYGTLDPGADIGCPICGDSGKEGHKPTVWQKVRPGDRLWVRETWGWVDSGSTPAGNSLDPRVLYRESDLEPEGWQPEPFRWRPSIHMPRWASRLTLEVTAVKMERLQEISATESVAEGIDPKPHECGCEVCSHAAAYCPATASSITLEFASPWRSLHGPGAWEANPEVVAMTFTVHRTNIDQKRVA